MTDKLYKKYMDVAYSTGIDDIIELFDTWSPIDDAYIGFGDNPKKKDFINFWLQTTDYHTIFKSRYYAEKAKHISPFLHGDDHIIKVCAGGDRVGYAVISPLDYRVRLLQR